MSLQASQLVAIPFHGDAIYCLPHTDPSKTVIAIRPTCEALGLDANGQIQRLTRR